MKDKLTIPNTLLDNVRNKCELANIKILSETVIGEESILVLRFRSPATLFTLGKYVFSPDFEKSKKLKHEKTSKKAA
jgi:hypothetical protein